MFLRVQRGVTVPSCGATGTELARGCEKVSFVMSISLSCAGLGAVNWDPEERVFEFVFDDEQVCKVHTVVAELLSPKVARLRKSDLQVRKYTFEKATSLDCYILLEAIASSIYRGRAIYVDDGNYGNLLAIAGELENTELLTALCSMTGKDGVAIETLIKLVRESSVGVDTLVNRLASQLSSIPRDALDKLDLQTIDRLCKSSSLRITDEDWLYDFIRCKVDHDKSFVPLFRNVCFEYLSADRIANFVEFAEQNLLCQFDVEIWRRVARRLQGTPVVTSSDREKRHISTDRVVADVASPTVFHYDSSKPLNGIIAQLTRECGGNVHKKGVVEVTASSDFVGQVPENVVDLEEPSCYGSENAINTWLCYDFKDKRVSPTSYTLRSRFNGSKDAHNLKSWVIEASNDGTSWQIIDRRDDNDDLNGRNVTHNFEIQPTQTAQAYRYVRLRQTGPNHFPGTFYFVNLSSFELFGTLSSQ